VIHALISGAPADTQPNCSVYLPEGEQAPPYSPPAGGITLTSTQLKSGCIAYNNYEVYSDSQKNAALFLPALKKTTDNL